MKTVLITEDEKLIRQGLCTMVQRAPLQVEQVLQARNGKEALQIMQDRQVDLLITDIRMPQMDGIELVEQVKQMENPPLILVISGYDDFSYAVSMLRNGVQDYLLKPVEREKFYECLAKIEQIFNKNQALRRSDRDRYLLALRYLMLSEHPNDPQRNKFLQEFSGQFFDQPYQAVLLRTQDLAQELSNNAITLQAMEDFTVQILSAEDSRQAQWKVTVGKSGLHVGLESLCAAYHEAELAWKQAFFMQKAQHSYEQTAFVPCEVSCEQLINLVQLSKYSEINRLLNYEMNEVVQGRCHPDAFQHLICEFTAAIKNSYESFFDSQDFSQRLEKVWEFPNPQQYMQELSERVEHLCEQLRQEFTDYESKSKIRQAVEYIQQNFRAPINMAMVSNHVSMNYSLFSLLFKQYTGNNFVGYLQNLRIEEAKHLLLDSEMKVNEISARAGFSGEKHFLKVFKATTGLSPSEWRKANRQKSQPL